MPDLRIRTRACAVLSAGLLAGVLSGCTITTRGVGSAVPHSSLPSASGTLPPSCPPSRCQLRLSASLAGPFGISVWADDVTHSAVVELTNGGSSGASRVLANESPAQLSCVSAGSRSHCILVDGVGAHSSVAHLLREVSGTLVFESSAQAATPTMRAVDLNHDGWIDVAGLQNDFTPSYADGQVYWQSWTSDGVRLRTTGCGARSHNPGSPPSVPLSGRCP